MKRKNKNITKKLRNWKQREKKLLKLKTLSYKVSLEKMVLKWKEKQIPVQREIKEGEISTASM